MRELAFWFIIGIIIFYISHHFTLVNWILFLLFLLIPYFSLSMDFSKHKCKMVDMCVCDEMFLKINLRKSRGCGDGIFHIFWDQLRLSFAGSATRLHPFGFLMLFMQNIFVFQVRNLNSNAIFMFQFYANSDQINQVF